jgi:hypothetical protein
MDLTSLTGITGTEIIAGIFTAILFFFFGHKHANNRHAKKKLTETPTIITKDIKPL